MVDSFNSGEFSSLDPVYQLPWASTFIRDFLNFVIKVGSLNIFDCHLELLPVFKTSWCPIVFKRLFVFFRPPLFGVFGNFRFFCVFCPSLVNDYSKLVDYLFEFIDVFNVRCVQTLEVQNDVLDESSFLVTFWGKSEFWRLDDLFGYGDVD